jgi:flagellar biosynthesis/type III secretory pathway M-ring protein FliF/YscJ
VEYVLAVILLLALVAAVVVRPLVLGVREESGESVSHEELEAAKEAKYREIRDAQLDFEMGKVSKEDHRAVDRELRAEAIEILQRLDALEDKAPSASLR